MYRVIVASMSLFNHFLKKPSSMTDIFLSYARNDHQHAKRLAGAFEKQGWLVWWDQRLLAGEYFDQVVRHQLALARCVIVLWSSESTTSWWVKKEALFGRKRGILIPVLLEDVVIPWRLRRIHAGSLVGWKGSRSSSLYKELVTRIESLLGPSPLPGTLCFTPLEAITSLQSRGNSFSGAYLQDCLNKAPIARRERFMVRHGIRQVNDWYLIEVRQFGDESMVLNKSSLKTPFWSTPKFLHLTKYGKRDKLYNGLICKISDMR